jgi:hypothetical protein
MKTQNINVKLREAKWARIWPFPIAHPPAPSLPSWKFGASTTRCVITRTNSRKQALSVSCPTWRQEPGVELSDGNPQHIKKAFDLYYDFDYDLAVRDMEETSRFLAKLPECNGKVAPSATASAANCVI